MSSPSSEASSSNPSTPTSPSTAPPTTPASSTPTLLTSSPVEGESWALYLRRLWKGTSPFDDPRSAYAQEQEHTISSAPDIPPEFRATKKENMSLTEAIELFKEAASQTNRAKSLLTGPGGVWLEKLANPQVPTGKSEETARIYSYYSDAALIGLEKFCEQHYGKDGKHTMGVQTVLAHLQDDWRKSNLDMMEWERMVRSLVHLEAESRSTDDAIPQHTVDHLVTRLNTAYNEIATAPEIDEEHGAAQSRCLSIIDSIIKYTSQLTSNQLEEEIDWMSSVYKKLRTDFSDFLSKAQSTVSRLQQSGMLTEKPKKGSKSSSQPSSEDIKRLREMIKEEQEKSGQPFSQDSQPSEEIREKVMKRWMEEKQSASQGSSSQ